MTTRHSTHAADGFSLIETLTAMLILTVGLLGLAQVFFLGLTNIATSSQQLIAREKAREAIESVHSARDTHTLEWADIHNEEAPTCTEEDTESHGDGVFVNGEIVLRQPGEDGLVNTDDDEEAEYEVTPGPDNELGTDDDVDLTGFWRQIEICDLDDNPNLRQVSVTIRYQVGAVTRRYRLMTYISKFA